VVTLQLALPELETVNNASASLTVFQSGTEIPPSSGNAAYTGIREDADVNGFEARLFYELYPDVPDEPDSLCYGVILIWQEGDTTLMLNALDMSRAEIFRIAEGIRPIRK